MSIIGILPAYNEASYLPCVLEEIKGLADLWILVDDGSTDGSGDILKEWAGRNPAVFLSVPVNKGKAHALKLAFQKILEKMTPGEILPDDIVYTTDADGQISREAVLHAVEEFKKSGADVLVCRRDFSIYPSFKVLGNRLLAWNASFLSGFKYKDSECGLRIMRAGVIRAFVPFFKGVRYSAEQEMSVLCPRLGFKVNNDYEISPRFYRSNTRILDFLVNISMGWAAFFSTAGISKNRGRK